MFKRVFSFVLIVVMSICTITANAQKNVYFAKHRYVQNEYGELLPRNDIAAYCPTRIEVDYDAKTLLVKTKTHGTASYVLGGYILLSEKRAIVFYDTEGKHLGMISFRDTSYSDFDTLVIDRKNDIVCYVN